MTTTREHLLSLFQSAPNGVISFEYRRPQYRHELPFLRDLVRAGYIRQIDKNTRTVFFKLTEQNGDTPKK